MSDPYLEFVLSKMLEDFLSFDDFSASHEVEKFLANHADCSTKDLPVLVVKWMTDLFLEIHQFGYQLPDDQTLEDLQEGWENELKSRLDLTKIYKIIGLDPSVDYYNNPMAVQNLKYSKILILKESEKSLDAPNAKL